MSNYIHLHNHSHYSLQDAASTIDGLVKSAKEFDMHAVALTDHGVMYGISEFSKKAKKEGVKPIVGMEAYIKMKGLHTEKKEEIRGKRDYNHLILIAKNKQGYYNLSQLSTIAHTEGFYFRPRFDLETLKRYSEGLICSSACPAGPISEHLVNRDFEKARSTANIFYEIFGDDFYLEMQDHGLDIEKPILEGMPKLSKELGIKLIVSNDVHYLKKEHSLAHNVLLLFTDKGDADYKQLRYGTDQLYFKSSEEMEKIFADFPEAITNTLEVADKADYSPGFEKFYFPEFPLPKEEEGKSLDEYFDKLAREGLKEKIQEITPEVSERFEYELSVIKKMGYSGYFLITQDFINTSKKNGIPVGPGRGSVAGSLIAFTLGITTVNPLEYGLLFERFLNPARQSMPDIDVDFADDRRADVIEYTKQKYGADSVSQIITFSRLSSRAVLKDTARVLRIPISLVNSITKYIPVKFGKVAKIEEALEKVPELKWVKESEDPKIKELILYASVLEDINRNTSKHAAGVIITPGKVSEYIPLARTSGGDHIVTQFSMKDIESAGLLKMDFLGLRTLSIIRDAILMIQKNHNVQVDIDIIDLNDPKTYDLFSRGQTTAVFQFESGSMREYLKQLKPNSILDLAAMNALYRPGPMSQIPTFINRKFGREKIEYRHIKLEPMLKETNGILVYQEQVLEIANKLAGMSLAEADNFRRAISKKDLKTLASLKTKFVKGMEENEIPAKIANVIYDDIEKFADYGFNKSHAVAYSILAFQTAWIKTYYLPEFIAANLTHEFHNESKVSLLLEDCRKLKVEVLNPDVNNPSVFFETDNNKIIFGLSAIKNVGVGAVEEIVRARKEYGQDFKTIFDFAANVDTKIVNKRTLEGLVLSGAMDSLSGSRSQKFAAVEKAIEYAYNYHSAKEYCEGSLFGSDSDVLIPEEPELDEIEPWDDKTKLAKEREVLGFYLSDHPLRKFELEARSFANVSLGDTAELTDQDEKNIVACGVVTEVRNKIDRSGNTMAFFSLDDFTGASECLMFAKVFEKFGDAIRAENPIMVIGRSESTGDSIKIHVDEAYSLENLRYKLTKSLIIFLDPKIHNRDTIIKLQGIFDFHNGEFPIYAMLKNNGDYVQFYLQDMKVDLSDNLLGEIRNLLGEDSLLLSKS
ncbi:MAG: DNA polymerase III subunit alpha [Ignavibacteriales bacterium]|nr:DNA polymerase III subunit alpha [Ignavibacteriales bacterium]MCF8315420.1 DNA polymerase III subunit alpha [Ignavibacteriales bacterium]MCF8438664.1 DNA polymerase III subunit alpha [Ignavibacteriales bacterium]